jgi:general secretion pathway protein L
MTALFENFNESLAKLKKQMKSSRFLAWWLEELSGMVPRWMRSSGPTLENYMVLPLEQVHPQMVKPVVAGNRVVAISLSNRNVLRKTISLPLATEENLRQVLEFQVEQHTPFSPDRVYFSYLVRARDFESKQLTVELVVAPRDTLDPATKILLGMGVVVRAVFADEHLTSGVLLNLMPVTDAAHSRSLLRQGANPWLAGIVLLLALAAAAIPPLVKREAVVQLLPWVEKGKKAAEMVSAVRAELEARVEQHNYLIEKRQASPAVIQVMEELTHILPDDTWIQVFDLKGRKLVIQGETASSSRLIGLFEKSTIFREASFTSALFKGQLPGTERYQLEIQLRAITKNDAAAQSSAANTPAPTSAGGKAP